MGGCRVHCYGDIYSSPGLDLRQKQILTAAFLVSKKPTTLTLPRLSFLT